MNPLIQIILALAGCFVAYLLLCAVVVLRTGTTDGLPAVGAAAHTFAAAVAGLLAGLLKWWPTSNSSPAGPTDGRGGADPPVITETP